MLKFAHFEEILEAQYARKGQGLMKGAHRAAFQYEPREGFLYVRSRAISSRCNDNYDEFPAEEIRKSWQTFIGKPVFVNHHNSSTRRARGVIIDAALHEDTNPDGSPDTWVEVLMEVDAHNFPKLAEAILAGDIERTSMGCDVAYSVCSACGNKAATPLDYCQHIPKQKGLRLHRKNASTGEDESVLIREICYGLGFFENSLLVEDPADPTAYFLGVDDRGVGGGYKGGVPHAASRNFTADLTDDEIEDAVEDVEDEGGFTLSTHGQRVPSDGYMVSLEGHEETEPLDEFGPEDIRGYLSRHYDVLKPDDRFLGGWLDASTVYLDTSQYEDDRIEAMTLGEQWHQLAIYDLGSKTEIRLDDMAKAAGSGKRVRFFAEVDPDDFDAEGFIGFLGENRPGHTASRNYAGGHMTKAAKKAINEVKAPSEIDTLRDEACPICGDTDSFDGERCLVCLYVKPPDPFMDPNLELAAEVDLRQEQMGDEGDDVIVDEEGDDGFSLDPEDGTEAIDDGQMPSPEQEAPGAGVPEIPGAATDPNLQNAQGLDEVNPADEATALPPSAWDLAAPNPNSGQVPVQVEDGTGLPPTQPGQPVPPGPVPGNGNSLEKPEEDNGDEGSIAPTPDGQPQPGLQQPTAPAATGDPYSPFTDPAAGQVPPVAPAPAAPVDQAVPAAPGQPAPAPEDAAPDENAPPADDDEEGPDDGFSLTKDDAPEDSSKGDEPGDDAGDDHGPDDEARPSDQDDDETDPVQGGPRPPKRQTDKHKRSNLMRPALRAIAEQQIRIQSAEAKIDVIAALAGLDPQMKAIDARTARRIAALRRKADADNPAQPEPESGSAAPVQTTQDALGDVKRDQPAGGSQPSANDITNPGNTDMTNVAPGATTTVTDPVVARRRAAAFAARKAQRGQRKQGEAILDEPLNLNKEDVTAPVDGTTGKRPLNEVRIETEIETSPSAESETQTINDAQGIPGPESSPAEKVSARTFAALRLARLRVQAGIAQGDDLVLGEEIARSAMSDRDIANEVSTLEKVTATAARRQPVASTQPGQVRRNLVPRTADRMVPSLAPASGFQPPVPSRTAGTPSSDEFLFEG